MHSMGVLFRFVFTVTVFLSVFISCNTSESITHSVTPTSTEIVSPTEVVAKTGVPLSDTDDINKESGEATIKVLLPTIIPVIPEYVETNLMPFILPNKDSALSISDSQGKNVNNEIQYEDQIYITWSILNDGTRDIVNTFLSLIHI